MRPLHPCPHPARRQRGAALLTAMIIVTLVATLAAAMVWQQWRAVQVESAERARAQSAWILSGALDFARLILREDMKSQTGRVMTALTEPWATPLAESRLSTFLAVDKSNTDDGPEAFLSGSMSDMQGRYNLMNLTTLVAKGQPDEELLAFGRLCVSLGLDGGVAARIASSLRAANAVSTSAVKPLWPETVAQLSWLGVDQATIHTLSPYVTMLPRATPLNVNTASKEALGAVIDSPVDADRLVKIALRTPFKDIATLQSQVPALTLRATALDVKSSFFEVRGRLRLVDRVLTERSLVERLSTIQGSQSIKVLQRERIAGLEELGS